MRTLLEEEASEAVVSEATAGEATAGEATAGVPLAEEATETLVPPVTWTTLGAVRAGEHGLYEFTDAAPTAGHRFYRALSP